MIHINGSPAEEYIKARFPREGEFLYHKLRNEVIKLADYIISTVFSNIMKCEGVHEIMV